MALKEAWDNSSIGQFANKAVNSVSAFYEKHKTVINIIVGAAVIGLCVAATVATAGTCGLAAMAAAGAIKGAAIGSAVGAVAGAAGGTFKGALSYMEEHDTLDGSGSYILEEAAVGFGKGAVVGATIGANVGAAKYAKAPTAYCFAAGTLVLTLAGMTAIENIKPGDIVYAKEATGIEQSVDIQEEDTLNSVLEIYEREVYETYILTIDGEEIETTANHPFYTDDGEAIEAKDLQEGDELSTSNGNSATVEKTEKVIHGEPIKVYNFAVMDSHTYYVGDTGVLVHNMCQKAVNDVADDAIEIQKNIFPENMDDFLPEIERTTSIKSNGTISQKIYTSDSIRIRAEKHSLLDGEIYNPRHHGTHYHVEQRIDINKSWNNPKNIRKIYPQAYAKGKGSGFLPGEEFPRTD